MKKLFTIISIITILTVGIFSLTGCGNKTNTNNGGSSNTKKNEEYQGATTGAGNNLKNVTENNYKDVAKEVFGIELSENSGWTLKSAKSPNTVNNLNIDYTVSNGEDGKTIINNYFNQMLKLGNIYSYDFNDSYTAMVKGTQYTTFESFAEENLTSIAGLTQAIWLYEYQGKNIQFSIDVNETSASLSFVLLG